MTNQQLQPLPKLIGVDCERRTDQACLANVAKPSQLFNRKP